MFHARVIRMFSTGAVKAFYFALTARPGDEVEKAPAAANGSSLLKKRRVAYIHSRTHFKTAKLAAPVVSK